MNKEKKQLVNDKKNNESARPFTMSRDIVLLSVKDD